MQVRVVENSTLRHYLQSMKTTHKKQMGTAEDKDEDGDNDIDNGDDNNESVLSCQRKISLQKKNISDQLVGRQSSLDSDRVMIDENQRSSAKKRKYENLSADYPLKLPKWDKAKSSVHDRELLQDSNGGKSHAKKNRLPINAVVDNVIFLKRTMQFITMWKEACRLLPTPEVWSMMQQYYKTQKKALPLGLFHVAVASIKFGMWDSIYNSFHAIHTEPENISAETSRERDALPIKGISINDISKKVCTYFDLIHDLPVEGKSALQKQFIFFRKLHDCHMWVTKQFSVKEFTSLGYGEFYRFLEEHPFLIPDELLESLSENVSKKSVFEVSMLEDQLVILLSQAASFLWEKDTITKEHVYKLLKKQFPAISFQVSGDGPFGELSELLQRHINADSSSSVLFSVPLLGNDYVTDPLTQNIIPLSEDTIPKPDSRLFSGALRSVSSKDAIQCLLMAPMLSDLQSWSHWDLIYAPSLGPLVEWLSSEVHMRELLCLVTKDGKTIRIDHSATINDFLEAFKVSAYEAAVKLLSLFSLYGGERKVPLALLKHHAQNGIQIILDNSMNSLTVENNCNTHIHDGKALKGQYALDREYVLEQPLLNSPVKNVESLILNDQHRINKSVPVASRFILDCLCYLPPEFRTFAAHVLLSGLQSLVKDAPSAVLRECSQAHQLHMLHAIGLSLNVCDWITDYRSFSSATAKNLSLSVGASSTVVESPIHCLNSEFQDVTLLSVHDDKMVRAEPDELNNVLGEVHDNNVTKLSTKKIGGGCKRILQEREENEDGTAIVESIRREEFGLISSPTVMDNIMLKKQHKRLGRALQCLSQELYSQDSHFLLELVQNADDNHYPKKVEPTLVFILQSTGLVVLNNERGFNAENIRALCDIGSSTKKGSNAGYIGHKGIGFKSVFRVTDCPEIHSNGFHVKFDTTEGQIGFVLPTVVSPYDIVSLRRLLPPYEANQIDTCWNTCIVLPFKSKLRDGIGLSTIVSMFSDLHPSILLFLHQLQCIKFKNMLNNTFTVMKREILEDGIIKVSHGTEIMNWFVATQTLQASVIRPDVRTTKIAVAFTLGESSDGEYIAHLEQQPVFAFLPLRTYGLKFILQGDFVLPSSREEVVADSAWNQWLLSEFPGLFVSALRSLCNLRCFRKRPGRAVAMYMSFVPLVGEVHGFFSQLPRMIISKLRVSSCLVLEGQEEWVLPCRVLRGWNEQVRILIPDNLLQQHLGLGYLDKDIYLSDSLAKALGVIEYGPRILIEIISSISRTDEDIKALGLAWLSSWFSGLYMILVQTSGDASINAWIDADLSEMLRNTPFIPLSDGTFGSVAEGTIWLRCDAVDCGFVGEHESEAFPSLYASLRIVSPAILSAEVVHARQFEELKVDNVIKMLLKIGVQRLSAHEVIRRHILPALSDDKSAERDMNLMTEYLSFVMLHLQSSCRHCRTERKIIISQLQTEAFILTNHGYRRPAEVPIHFSREFGNPVDMTKLIDVMNSDWHEVDITYLKHSSNKSVSFGLLKWRDFFQELGITDFVQVVQVEKNIAKVSHTVLNDFMCNGDLLQPGCVFKDWESHELINLLSTLSAQNNQEKSIYLLGVLDIMWDDCFHEKVRGCCIYGSNEDGKLFKSSFIRSISDFQWMASSFNQNLCYPKDIFCDCEEVRSILGNFAPYAVPQVGSKTFLSDIGLKTRVTIEDALEVLQVLRSFKAAVTVSIDQMSKCYAFIWGEMGTAKVKVTRRLSSGPYIFIPFANDARPGDVIAGKLFSPDEVYWHDPTGCVDLLKEIPNRRGPLYEINHPTRKMLAPVYQGLHDFFVNECKVCEVPPPRSYIQILVQLSKVVLPSQAANAVLQVILKWADDLKSGLLKLEDVVYLKECLVKLETTVLPTQQDKWVSLHPTFGLVFWCDNQELQKQFKHFDNVNALYFGESKLHEQEVLPEKVSGLMQALGIPSLSEVVTREAIFDSISEGIQKASLVGWVLPYVQRYIYKFHPDKYVQLKQSGFGNLWSLRVVVVEKLFSRHTVNGCGNASNPTECSCLLEGNSLYIDEASNLHPIFMELSRLFFDGSTELHLANFLCMITTMSESGATDEQTEFFVVDSQKIPKLPDDEPRWSLATPRQVYEEDEQVLTVERKRKRGIETDTDWVIEDLGEMEEENTRLLGSSSLAFRKVAKYGKSIGDSNRARGLTGRRGELVAFRHFAEKLGDEASVKWVNEERETGLPYDITTIVGDKEEYIEVKATAYGEKDWFSLSTREWQFAVERGEAFSIAHVVLMGPNEAKIAVFKNVFKLCQQRLLLLAVVMPKTRKEILLVTDENEE